jgi:hypothetical protein
MAEMASSKRISRDNEARMRGAALAKAHAARLVAAAAAEAEAEATLASEAEGGKAQGARKALTMARREREASSAVANLRNEIAALAQRATAAARAEVTKCTIIIIVIVHHCSWHRPLCGLVPSFIALKSITVCTGWSLGSHLTRPHNCVYLAGRQKVDHTIFSLPMSEVRSAPM